ncbi:hypothetical protein JTE90_010429 [Oedothorax gibbosus]|uniref:SH2 domain-containing protein n=1 Tax=Oedothorax gibbosus TaxID=931172 RepID=A0AAV6VZN6_9ARAC|nr:hypothetical protein JTE90_010429 [Oedothorax gibbosus]
MSNFQPQIPLSNETEFASDGSWCSDFDDFSETSEVWNIPLSEDYSKEIEDNKINEHIEAKLYGNMPPLQCSSAKNILESETTTTSAPRKELSETKFGAIPKTAFSYLNNELHQNLKPNLLNKDLRQSTKHLDDEREKLNSRNTPPLPVKPSIKPLNINNANHNNNKKTKEGLEINQHSNIVTSPQKTPSKLKPEAFSFLSKVIKNQPPFKKEDTTIPFERRNDEQLSPSLVDEEKRISDSTTKSMNFIERNKCESFEPQPTAPFLYDFEDSFTQTVDPVLSPLQIKNTNKTVQQDEKNTTKPPLPDRPPPVSKFPPEIFSQHLSPKTGVSNEHNFKPNSQVQVIPDIAIHCSVTDPAILKIEQKHEPLVQEMQNKHKRERVMSDRPNDVSIKSIEEMDIIKYPRNHSLPDDINIPNLKKISERPLPPLPISTTSKMNQNTNIKPQNDISESKTIKKDLRADISVANQFRSEIETATSWPNRNASALTSEQPVQILQDTRLEDQTFEKQYKPDLKPKPKKRIDIISQQTNVSSQTFHSQQEISAALRTRLQNGSSKRLVNVSYEEPKNQSDLPSYIDQEDSKRFSDIMTSSKQVISSYDKSDRIDSKRISPARKISDIDEIQQAIIRPTLPQKLRTTQRSLSCTSLVQTFKDIGFSIWSNNDKEKRKSEGRNSSEFTSKNFPPEIRHIEKSTIGSPTTAFSADKEIVSKGLFVHEEEIGGIQNQRKSITSSAWYHHLNARDAQRLLLSLGEDGTFLIRPSTNPTADIQYTSCVVYSGRVFNLHIRRKPNGQYALGKEKHGEMTFSSISDLIKYHQEVPIEIRPTSRSLRHEFIYVYLRVTPPK